MSPSATSVGPAAMCHTMSFDCGVTEGSCAETMNPPAAESVVLAGTGVAASVPSAFFSRWLASAKWVVVTEALQVDWVAGGLGIAHTSAVTKGNDDWLVSKTLVPTSTQFASWPSLGKSGKLVPVC